MIDKYYFIKGGAERYLFELSRIMEAHNHRIIPFSMKHPRNVYTPYEDFFVDHMDYDLPSIWIKAVKSPVVFSRMIYSLQARNRLDKLINKTKPDIAHLHMIDHQLSPSILHVLKKYGIPVIQTVHQYKMVCPNYRLYNMRTHKICEKCLDGHYYHPIFERCHKNSSTAGLMLAMETVVHKAMKIYENCINLFHVPSRFMGIKLQENGIDGGKIEHLFYTIELNEYKLSFDSDNYFIYYGRLSNEKGILTLLKAMRNVKTSQLFIVGDGPQKEELESFAFKHQLRNVRFVGLKGGEELKSLVAHSKFVVVPSEWYDNSPLVIYESFALGKPVIGSALGGIPELVEHENTGLLFRAGDSDMLTEAIQFLLHHPGFIKDYGFNARMKAEKQFNPRFHYREMIKKYRKLLGRISEN